MNTDESLFNSLLHFSDHLLYYSKYDVNLPQVILINLTLSAKSLPWSIIHFRVVFYYYCSTGTAIFTPKTVLFSIILYHMVSSCCCLGTGPSCVVTIYPTFLYLYEPFDRAIRLLSQAHDEVLWKYLRYILLRSFRKCFGKVCGGTIPCDIMFLQCANCWII